ncbi:VOC family protein [Thermophilibacter mediterraneus]|nr:VOC family protein [Thermophilibacter mediterraneus]
MRIEHAALYVNDLEGARDFFVRFFGATSNDGYYEPCVLGPEGNQVEITV